MFFRRKPKAKPDREESLVPHGLIWQATAQEEPQSALPKARSSALNQPKPTIEASFDGSRSSRRLGAISPPIAWPSPRIQEIPRRPHSHAETERMAAMAMGQVIPLPYAEQPHLSRPAGPKIEPSRPEVLEARQPVTLSSLAPKTHSPFRERFRAFGERFQAVERSWALARQEVQGNVHALIANVGQRFHRIGGVLSAQLQRALLWPRSLKSPIRAMLTTSGTAKQRLLSRGEATWNGVENWFGRSADAVTGVWQRKIRVGLHSAWSMPIAPSKLRASVSGWKSKTVRLRFDSRLWTSMAMAAASAGLALGMINLVRRYSPQAAPVHTRSFPAPTSPSKHGKSTNSVSHPNVNTGRVLVKPSAARSATPPPRIQTPAKSPTPAARKVQARKPRSHNSEDADYVARDTYVYYGASGKK
jgi:hypothetical protein